MDRVSRRRFLGGAGAALGLALLGKAPRGLAAGMAPRVEYRLPYPGGVTWRVVQGNNTTGTHQGYFAYAWDFRMPVGSPITAARGGVVSGVKQDSDEHGWGPAYADKNNYILIDHGDGTTGEYLHIPRDGARVRVGQRVEQGEMIGFSGFTGQTRGPHLHFMVQVTTPGSWYAQSLPIRFADVPTDDGVPQRANEYRSGNRRHAELELMDGRFYTQTNGAQPGGGRGYAVRDDSAMPFWTAFQQLGGVAELGYPISSRLTGLGTTIQLFQRQALAWDASAKAMACYAIMDLAHQYGKDGWLLATYGVPPYQEAGDPDDALTWDARPTLHRDVLLATPWLARAYASVRGGADARYGLVTAWPLETADVVTVRTQKAVLQRWKHDVPWARPGQVTLASAGEMLKASGTLERRLLEPDEFLPDRTSSSSMPPLPWER